MNPILQVGTTVKKNICPLLFKIEILDKYFSWNNSLTNIWLSIFKMFNLFLKVYALFINVNNTMDIISRFVE